MRIKKSFCIILIIALPSFGCTKDDSNPSKPNNNDIDLPGYTLIWNDEFDSTKIDLSKWSHEINAWGGGNNELQYYTDRLENSFVQDGYLHIVALQEEYTGDDGTRYYTSARMRTMNKGDWINVRIDVCAKLPFGQGMWPAIWMLPTDWEYGGWPNSGEIDIMEHINSDPEIHGSIHTEAYNHRIGTQKSGQMLVPDANENFHIYSIEWFEDRIDFFVDNVKYFSFANDENGDSKTWPFDKRFHLLLNVAVGGDWPGNPTTDTIFPKEMVIDYVRVYKKTE